MTLCAACGLPGHRYGRNDGMERFDPIACINQLRGELEKRTLPGFTECPECEGGIDLSDDGYPTGLPCPSCSGVGVVPDPETVEAVAFGLWIEDSKATSENYAVWGHLTAGATNGYRRQARAALLAYARKAKEQT